ncbi:MAG: discoidin domain-containing protein, partial [Bacteroidota bacterium]
ANWDDRNSLAYGNHIIAPGGAMVAANDGSFTGGVFANYNGSVLSDGDHYLLEIRGKDLIKVFQPLGGDTPLCVLKPTAWKGVRITAHDYAGRPLGEVPATALKDRVTFMCAGTLQNKRVCYYAIAPSSRPNAPTVSTPTAPDLVVTDVFWSPAKPLAGERVYFEAVVKNRGTGVAPGGAAFRVAFSLDDQPVAFWSEHITAPIPPGAAVTVEAAGGTNGRAWVAAPGDHTLTARVDDTGLLAESDEANNQSSRALPAIEAPAATERGTAGPPAGPKNLALNRPATASSHTDIYVAANATDGFTSSYWESTNNVFPSFLAVDLGEVRSVNKIVLKLPPGWEPRTQTLAILGSADNKTYATVVGSARYNFDPASNNVVTISFAATELRYLRIEFTENTGWPAGQAAELEVYQ